MARQAAQRPVLAGSVGHYSEAAPVPQLRDAFQCLWFKTVPEEHTGPVAVVPDGHADLIWRDGRLVVAGPDITAATPTLRPGTTVFGLRFQPGAARHWLGLPMSELVGRQVDLADLWGRCARDMTEILAETSLVELQARRLQALLADRLGATERPDRAAAAIFALIEHDAGAVGPKIARLLERLDVSERTLRRHSRDHFGYGPKTLDRILRFQRFLALARSEAGAGLADLAIQAGYADQPHLSRDVRDLCGLTAGTALRQTTG